MQEIRNKIEALREVLHDHNHRYYILDDPIISDYEFDQLLQQLNELEVQNPDLTDLNSPTRRVGGVLQNLLKLFHISILCILFLIRILKKN